MKFEESKAADLIKNGSEIAGAAVGGALGFLAAGPAGAAVSGVAGVLLAAGVRTVADFAFRQLSHREEIRVGGTAAFAINDIRERLERGDQPRGRDFFEPRDGERSSASELFEGVLQKAKNEHEEKKVRLLGNFFSNVLFSEEISLAEANQLLRLAEDLTYRQLCLLALVCRQTELKKLPLRTSDYRGDRSVPLPVQSVLQEIFPLHGRGLAGCVNETRTTFDALLGWTDINPSGLIPTPFGVHVFVVLGLGHIPHADLEASIAPLLATQRTEGPPNKALLAPLGRLAASVSLRPGCSRSSRAPHPVVASWFAAPGS